MSARAERKRAEKEQAKKTVTYNYTQDDLKRAVEKALMEERRKVIDIVVHQYTCALAIVLRDKLDFGRTRLLRALEHVNDTFDSIDKGYLSMEDIKKTIADETGIDLVVRT